MHFHTYHNIAGYMPEGDAGTHETIVDAMRDLADELARAADDLYERCEAFKMPDDRRDLDDDERETQQAMEAEGDRVHAIATELESQAETIRHLDDTRRHYSLPRLDHAVTIEGETYPLAFVEANGIGIGVSDPSLMHDLGVNYYAMPCELDDEDCEAFVEEYGYDNAHPVEHDHGDHTHEHADGMDLHRHPDNDPDGPVIRS